METKKTINITETILEYHNKFGIRMDYRMGENVLLEDFYSDWSKTEHLPHLEKLYKHVERKLGYIPYCINVNPKLSLCYIFDDGEYKVFGVVGFARDFEIVVFYILTRRNPNQSEEELMCVETPENSICEDGIFSPNNGAFSLVLQEVDELFEKYGMPHKQIKSWTRQDRIAIMLRVIKDTKR